MHGMRRWPLWANNYPARLRSVTALTQVSCTWGIYRSGPVLGEPLFLDSDITPEPRLLHCVQPSLSNLEHYSGRNVGAVMFQVRQQKSKGLAQAVFRKTTSGNQPTAGPDRSPLNSVKGKSVKNVGNRPNRAP